MRTTRRRDGERGQGLIEFALVVPVFALLLFGLIDLGRLVYANNAVSQAAREGTRWGMVQQRSATASGRATVATATRNRITAVPSPTITVTCERNGVVNPICRPNDTLVVRVESNLSMLTPVIAQLVGPVKVSAISKARVNQ